MAITFNRLWELMKSKNVKKQELKGIMSPATITKLRRNEIVTTETIEKICVFLDCDICDICELSPETNGGRSKESVHIDANVLEYFKKQSEASGIPYQTLVNSYLEDCVKNNRQLKTSWN